MAPLPHLRCPPGHDFLGGVARRAPRKSALALASGLAVGLLVVATGASAYSRPASFIGSMSSEEVQSKCTEDGGVVSCVCNPTSSTTTNLEATLSEIYTELQVSCGTGLDFVPKVSATAKVCPAETATLSDCTDAQPVERTAKTSFEVADLLSGDTSSIAWKDSDGDAEGKPKVLELAKENLPTTEKQFVVGCDTKARTNKGCKVTVTLKPKTSTTDGQKVTCSYGKESNGKRQVVTLSPSQRSFTLDCGKEGDVVPADYREKYCTVGDAFPPDAEDKCEGQYTTILPAYKKEWWKQGKADNGDNTVTLEVPPDGFPQAEAKLLVGCRHKPKHEETRQSKQEETAPETTVCKVEVTIAAAEASASPVPTGVLGVCLVGAGSVMSLLVHHL